MIVSRQNFAAILIAFSISVFYILRSVSFPSPIMASDEYAYYVLSKYLGTNIFSLDPLLQPINNRLFFAWQHFCLVLGGESGSSVMRFFHLFELFAIVIVLYKTFEGILEKHSNIWAACIVLLMPSSFFSMTVLPETDLVMLAVAGGFVLVRWLPVKPLLSCALAGFISGIALLIKPHAAAWVPAILLALTLSVFINPKSRHWFRDILFTNASYIGGWYGGFVIGWWSSGSGISLNPGEALGLKFYGSLLARSGQNGFLSENYLSLLLFFIAHLLTFSVIFFPAVVALGYACRIFLCKHVIYSRQLGMAFIFVLSMIVMHLAMVSCFSVSVSDRASETYRLHGRYLGVVLVYLPFFYLLCLDKIKIIHARGLALGGLAVTGLFYLLVIKVYKIFPWDYPELFAFFTSPNHYGWSFAGGYMGWGYITLFICMAGFSLVSIKPAWCRPVLIMQLILVLFMGQFQMQRWLRVHMQDNSFSLAASTAIRNMVAPSAPGDGLVIGEDRFGKMSYVLFALNNSPRVLVKDSSVILSPEEVKGAKWVVLVNSYEVKFDYRNVLKFGGLELYTLSTTSPVISNGPKKHLDHGLLEFQFGDPAFQGNLIGFNPPESWGAWTSKSIADVELPDFIRGNVRLRFSGWVLPENPNKLVHVTIGDVTQQVTMTETTADYFLDVFIKNPVDRIRFKIPIVRPVTSSRDMGVALQSMKIELAEEKSNAGNLTKPSI